MGTCKKCGGNASWYGMAPHGHGMSRTGSIIGSTVVQPKDTWPPNFTPDPDADGCGVWTCEQCKGTGREPLEPYDDGECRHTRRFENGGVLTCQDCAMVYDERTTEWKRVDNQGRG
jgi:hypothetical protein